MGKVQKVYTKDFKEEAVRLVQTSGKSRAQIARFIAGAKNWRNMEKKRFREKDIKRELERVQQERDILKKGVSIFSWDQR